ncbi:MAG TPA: YceD family protein [Gammaproteobacteria bacterium]|nr:YceD family protein [Gammaproteobacteria bacterium]
MPRRLQAWYGFSELAAFGDRGAELTGDLKVAQLTRLHSLLHTDAGEIVAVRAKLGRTNRGQLMMSLSFDVKLKLVCQRCLEPVEIAVDEQVEWGVVESESERAALASGVDALVLEDERIQLAALVEDEIILSLPMVPRHASIDECGALAQNLKPFLRMHERAPLGTTLKV